MAKRRSHRVQVQSTDIAVGTGVHAPSTRAVQSTAANNAAAIAAALGVAGSFYGDYKARKDAADFNDGVTAAMKGEVSEEELARLEKSRAYVRGATLKIAEGRAIKDADEIMSKYQTEFDKTGSMEDLDTFLRGAYEEKYASLSPDMYNAVLPYMERSVRGIMGAHAQLIANETQAQINDSIVVSTQQALQDGTIKSQEDWNLVREEALKLTGSTDATNDLLFSAVKQHVMETGDTEVWNQPWLEKLRTNPKYAEAAAKSQDDAEKAAKAAWDAQTVVPRAQLKASLKERADAADETVLIDVEKAYNEGYIDAEEVEKFTYAYADATAKGFSGSVHVDAAENGTLAQYNLNDTDYNAALQGLYQKFANSPDEATAQNALAYTIQAAQDNGRMPQFLTRLMKDASPSNPDAFQKGYEIFSTARSANPAGYQDTMSEDLRQKYEAYEVVLADEGDPQRAIDKLTQADRKRIGEWDKAEYRSSLEDAIDNVADGPWFNNADITSDLRQTVRKRYDYMLSLGYDPEKSAEFAVNDIQSRYTIHNGTLWPNTSKLESTEVLDFNIAQAKSHDAEGRDYEIVPADGQPGYAFIRPVGGLAFGGQKVKVSTLNENYQASQRALRDHEIKMGQERVAAELLDRAKARATGIYGAGRRGNARNASQNARDSAWDRLTPAEKQAAIDEIEAEDLARKERVEAARQRQVDAAADFATPNAIL